MVSYITELPIRIQIQPCLPGFYSYPLLVSLFILNEAASSLLDFFTSSLRYFIPSLIHPIVYYFMKLLLHLLTASSHHYIIISSLHYFLIIFLVLFVLLLLLFLLLLMLLPL